MLSEPKRTEVEEEEMVVVSPPQTSMPMWVRGKVWGVVTGEADSGGGMDDTP